MAHPSSSSARIPAENSSSIKVSANFRSRNGYVPSHLYLKGKIYYFRYALPKCLKEHLGGTEVRLSLRTSYLRKANVLAGKLRDAVATHLQGRPMLTLPEIKSRLSKLLLEGIDDQAHKLETFKNCDPLQELLGAPLHTDPVDAESIKNIAHARYTDKRVQEEMFRSFKAEKLYGHGSESLTEEEREKIIAMPFSTEAYFNLYIEKHIPHLTSRGLFTEKEIAENKDVIAKLYMQFENILSRYVAEDEAGNTLEAQKIMHEFLSTLIPPVATHDNRQQELNV
jgi:hypothetical protein